MVSGVSSSNLPLVLREVNLAVLIQNLNLEILLFIYELLKLIKVISRDVKFDCAILGWLVVNLEVLQSVCQHRSFAVIGIGDIGDESFFIIEDGNSLGHGSDWLLQ